MNKIISEKTLKKKIFKFMLIPVSIFTLNYLLFNYTIFLIIPVIKTLVFFLSVFGCGVLINKIFKKKYSFFEVLSVGVIFTFFIFYFLSFIKFLKKEIFLSYFVFGLVLFFYFLKKEYNQIKEKFIDFNLEIEHFVIIIFFTLYFIFASLPPSFYDSLVYHLGIPNLYLQNGGFVKTLNFLYANTSIYYEVFLIPAVFLGDEVPRLFHFLFSFLFIVEFISFVKESYSIKKGWLVFIVILTMPITAFLMVTVKNDVIASIFIYLGVKFFLKKRYIESGIFFGFSIGVKYFSFLGVFLFFLVDFIFEVFFRKKLFFRKYFLISFLIIVLLLPLFIKNFYFTGNPVFPFMFKVFKTSGIDTLRYEIMRKDVGRIIRNSYQAFTFPYYVSFYAFGSGGKIGPLLLVFLPFLAFFRFPKPELFTFSILSFYSGAFFTGSVRFMYFALIFLLPYVVIVLERFEQKFLKIVFIVIVSLNLISSLAMLERYYKASSLYTFKSSKEG